MVEYILEARDVEFTYPDGTEALRGVSVAIEKGQKVAFLGSNGSGKSTLFLHFNGILRAKRGKILFAGKDVSYDRSSLTELRKHVGIVFQDPDTQLFSASVLQEISFGPMNLGLSKEYVLQRVHAAMAATEITELRDKPTHFLSYGQKKRVSIADILAMEPSVLICDEPTAWLDPQHTFRLLELFDRISQGGTTVVMSTHDVDAAYSWADYIFIMDAGRVIGAGPPEEVFQNDGLLQQADLSRPWLVEVYAELQNKGWLAYGTPVPRTKEELFACIPATWAQKCLAK
ncbi:MAG: energy-coupling factor ABC transporter ATP-binding protein [Bacillota bacterium]